MMALQIKSLIQLQVNLKYMSQSTTTFSIWQRILYSWLTTKKPRKLEVKNLLHLSSGKTNCSSGHNYIWYQSIWNNIKLLKSQKTVTKQNWNIKSKLSRYKDKLNNLNKQVHKWLTNQFFEASVSFEKIYFWIRHIYNICMGYGCS